MLLADLTPLRAAAAGSPTLGDVPTAERSGPDTAGTPALTRTADGREAVANRIIVGFRADVSDTEKDAVTQAVASQGVVSVTPVRRVSDAAQAVDVSGAPSLESAIQSYLTDPRVQYAEPDYVVHALDLPNDQYFDNQYGMSKVQAPGAWGITHGVGNIKIAILDCGIYDAHPDLAGKVVAAHDFTGSASGTDDRCDHGTHVAGIASAVTNNGTGVAGLGYDTKLLNGKILTDTGIGYQSVIADGIRWAADTGAKVINMSLGASGACSQTFQDAINYAWGKNVVIVAAAGNSNGIAPMQPADCTHVVAVASTDGNDARSAFSNYGGWVQLAAPGSSIYSTVNPNLPQNDGSAYAYLSGTSMAAPHVAGLAALLWSTGWGSSAQMIVQRMEGTADHINGTGASWQFGRINAMAAVAANGAPPTATGLTPNSVTAGSAAFTLTVTGTDFRPGASLLWNGTPQPILTITDTQVTATIAAPNLLNPGGVSIAVANADATITAILRLTITPPPPQATAITPSSGSSAGGITVQIRGTSFQPGATVAFGGLAATVLSVTSSEIVVLTPAHEAGTVDVIVTNPDGQSQTMTNAYLSITLPTTRTGTTAPAASIPAPASRTAPSPATSSGPPPPLLPPPPPPTSR